MLYESLVHDFARRTLANLDTLSSLKKQSPNVQFYEVTNLINSMLGLLIFPQQTFMDEIPPTPIAELRKQGWPIPRVRGRFEQLKNLKELVRYLRNAIAHCNVMFQADSHGEINGLILWNSVKKDGLYIKTWEAEISVTEIEIITRKFIELILSNEPKS